MTFYELSIMTYISAFPRYTSSNLPLCGGLVALALIVLAVACAPSEEKPIAGQRAFVKPFEIPSEWRARKTDVRHLDITGDGLEDAIVMLYRADSSKLARGFETLVLYRYEPASQTYVEVFRQQYFYGTSVDVRDINHDGAAEVIVKTDGGGNSALASQGMSIIARSQPPATQRSDGAVQQENKNNTEQSGYKGTFREINALDEGAPELTYSGQDSTAVVLSYTRFTPDYSPESDAIRFVDSVLVLSESAERREQIRKQVFQELAARTAQQYRQTKTLLSIKHNDTKAVDDLYTFAAAQLFYLRKLGQVKEAQAFRATEQQYWRTVLADDAVQALLSIAAGERP